MQFSVLGVMGEIVFAVLDDFLFGFAVLIYPNGPFAPGKDGTS